MVKFFRLLLIGVIGVAGCTSNRVFVMTPHSDDASFVALNKDLAKHSEVAVIPDSLWEKRDWEASRDTANIPGANEVTDANFDFGAPRSALQIRVNRDSTVYTLIGATSPSRINTWHLRELFFEDKHRSRPLGMITGCGIGAAGGAVIVASLVFGSGDEHMTADDQKSRVIAIAAGAAIGGMVGLIGGIWYPIEITQRTHILFLPYIYRMR